MAVKAADIAKIVELFEASDWKELHVEIGGMQLFLSTDPTARLASASASPEAVAPAPPTATPPPAATSTAAPVAPALSADSDSDADIPANWEAVKAPNLGTFYGAPQPGAEPYVQVGQTVEPDSEICLIEVMKLFTTLKAGLKGTVRRICVSDSEMVEAGQVLFYIERV